MISTNEKSNLYELTQPSPNWLEIAQALHNMPSSWEPSQVTMCSFEFLQLFNKTPPSSHQMPGCVSSAGDKNELTDWSERQTQVVHASCTVMNDFLMSAISMYAI